MSPDIGDVTLQLEEGSEGDEPLSNTDPNGPVPDWGRAPDIHLHPRDDRKSAAPSEISGRESAKSLHTIVDMGHRDWLESLRDQETSLSGYGKSTDTTLATINVNLSSILAILMKNCVKSAIGEVDRETFLPFSRLLQILSPSNVEKLLREKFSKDPKGNFDEGDKEVSGNVNGEVYDEFANEVYDENLQPKRLKVMGTLLLMGRLELLRDFIKAKVDDHQLPLAVGPHSEWPRLYDRAGNKIVDSHLLSWKYQHAEYFMMKQMQICTFFCTLKRDRSGYVDHFRLPKNFVPPFIVCQSPEDFNGGFGTVTKVQIEPSHLWYKSKSWKPELFAVKTIFHNLPAHPEEADSLARRPAIRDKADREHLHHLLFSFRRHNLYYFVFEWADGDLTKLWKEMPGKYSPGNQKDVCWFFRQCTGIARSLNSLHNLHPSLSGMKGETMVRIIFAERYGCHSDIKPENILWFRNYEGDKTDHLVIADFGATRFHSTKSKSGAPLMGYTQTYKAPEADTNQKVGPKIDIWALGCVFLEHVSVFLRGDPGCVKKFSDRRLGRYKHSKYDYSDDCFYRLVGDHSQNGRDKTTHNEGTACSTTSSVSVRVNLRAVVKGAVKKWIEELQKHELCSAAMNDFLNLIRDGMLVTEDSKRYDGEKLLAELNAIRQRCDRDAIFACFPKGTSTREEVEREDDAISNQSHDLLGISGGDPSVGDTMMNDFGNSLPSASAIRAVERVSSVGLLPDARPSVRKMAQVWEKYIEDQRRR